MRGAILLIAAWAPFSEGEEKQRSFHVTDQSPAPGVWQNPDGSGLEGSDSALTPLHLLFAPSCPTDLRMYIT